MKAWKFLVLILAIAFLLRALPLSYTYFSDPDSFFHARSVNMIISGQAIPGFDPISQQGRVYPNPPLFHAVYASFGILSGIGTNIMLRLLSIIMALATILLIYCIAARVLGKKIALLSAFALSIMVLHIYRTAGFPRPDAFGLMLLGLGVLLFLMRERLLCGIIAIAIALTNPVPTGIAFMLSLLAFWGIRVVKKQDADTKAFLGIAVIFGLAYGVWLLHFEMPWNYFYSQMSFEAAEMQHPTLLWDASTLLFAWIFALFAFVKLKGNWLLRAWAAMLFVFGIFAIRFTFFLTLPLSILTGFGIWFFREKTKKFGLAFCGLVALLALLTSIPVLFQVGQYVSIQEGKSMEWLSLHTDKNSSIASDWDQGDAIGFLGQRKVVVDGHFEFNPSVQARNYSIKIITASSDCGKISAEAEKWGIDYYYVSARDRNSLTYANGLLEAKCDFISKVYENGSSMIIGFSS